MRIHCIFEEIKDKLYAVAYDDTQTSVLTELRDQWSDIEWLENFFEANKRDLQGGFYGTITVEEAVDQTYDEADRLFEELLELDGTNLSQLFRPLHNLDFRNQDFQEQKAKGKGRQSWLRLYAVHNDGKYYITGGAIKLTRTMQERPHTDLELRKLRRVKDTLKLNEADDRFVYLDI
jgi:hypothetical protein